MSDRVRIERLLVILVALHSYIVGLMLFLVPRWAVAFAGWAEEPTPIFFLRQAGVFHFVVATGYLIEYFRYRGVRILVTAKTMAFVFLLAESMIWTVAWSVPFCGVADGAMALVVLLAHRWAAAPAADPAALVRERTA